MFLHDIVTPLTIEEAKATKTRLDPKCWAGKHKEGTKIKGGVRVNNCVSNENIAEGEVDEVFGFQTTQPAAKKSTSTLAQMRKEFEKQATAPQPRVVQNKDADEVRAREVHVRQADEAAKNSHGHTRKQQAAIAIAKQGVAEGDLNELAPSSGEGGNGPFDYGSAIIEIGQNFVDNYADSAAGEDAADIIQVGKTFMSAGMTKGISALFELDTQVYDHVLDELSSLGFNVDLDIISKRRAPTLDRDTQNAMRAAWAKFNAQPGQVYTVTGYLGGGWSSSDIKATSPEAAKQKFIADFGTEFDKIDVKPYQPYQGVAEGKADYNFDIEDLKRLERIRDLPTLKTQALALISKPSGKPMKPEKVEWFKNALDNQRMNSPMKVIKLMYDLLLSGEGNAVVGTRSSMNPNSYRQRFGEQGVAEDSWHGAGNDAKDAWHGAGDAWSGSGSDGGSAGGGIPVMGETTGKPLIRPVKYERADGSIEVTYELLAADGRTIKTGMSKEIAMSLLKHYRANHVSESIEQQRLAAMRRAGYFD